MDEGDYPFYTSSSILSKWINKALYDDDALIFGTGGSASIHFQNKPFSTSTDCIVAITKSVDLNVKYVYYYLLGNIQILERGFKGAGLKHISKKYIENLDIPMPPIETQNKIVTVLDKVSSLVDKRIIAIKLLDELLRAIFLDIFGDPIVNSNNWNSEPLGEVAKLERGRFSPRPRNDPSFFGGHYPFIQTGDIKNSNYRLNNYVQTLNDKGVSVSKQFNAGDIVIALVGATIGATSILQINAYATDSIIAIRSQNKTNNIFLEMLMRFYRQYLLDTAPSGVRANINLSILGKLNIIVPPMDLQDKYKTLDANVNAQRQVLVYSLEQLENLKKAIIQKAFNGQLNFNIDIELDALIDEIDLCKKENDLTIISSDFAYLQRLIDRLEEHEFKNKNLYNKAKYAIFQLLKEDEKIAQKYDEKRKKLKLVLK